MSRARIESRTDRITKRATPAVRLPGGRGYNDRGDARLEPVHRLRHLVDQRAQLEGRISVSVQELRAAGASWSVIGDVLGVTRSAAQKRYGRDELLHG